MATKKTTTALDLWVEEQIKNGLEYGAKFVPLSESRNALPDDKEPTHFDQLSVNWRITLKRGNSRLECDYSCGVGHLEPRPKLGDRSLDNFNAQWVACENGSSKNWAIYRADRRRDLIFKVSPPTLADVLYSLSLDSNVLNYSTFEEWAADFGYDLDSRKAEQTYQGCLKIALQLRNLLGERLLAQLAEHAKDY